MQRGGIEIRLVESDYSEGFRVNPHIIEQGQITQWAMYSADKKGFEVNGLLRAVVELYPQCIRPDDIG